MACLKSSVRTIYASESFFPASVGKELSVFLYCFHTSILIGSPVCASWSDTTALNPLLLPLWQLSSLLLNSSLWYPEWRNLLLLANLWDAGFRPWYLWEQDLGAKCLPQNSSIMRATSEHESIQCLRALCFCHTYDTSVTFKHNLQLFMHVVQAKGSKHICIFVN